LAGDLTLTNTQAGQTLKLINGETSKTRYKSLTGYRLKLNNVTSAQRADLLDVYNYARYNRMYYVPHPITPSTGEWNGIASPVIWNGGFDFYNPTGNTGIDGYDGDIRLAQAGGKE
jgi:hypothetical protein